MHHWLFFWSTKKGLPSLDYSILSDQKRNVYVFKSSWFGRMKTHLSVVLSTVVESGYLKKRKILWYPCECWSRARTLLSIEYSLQTNSWMSQTYSMNRRKKASCYLRMSSCLCCVSWRIKRLSSNWNSLIIVISVFTLTYYCSRNNHTLKRTDADTSDRNESR